MCGRFAFFDLGKALTKYGADLNFERSFNISPGQHFPVVYKKDKIKVELKKWGLIPHWAKNPSFKG